MQLNNILTFTTVRIPSLVSGSVSILKCPPSSPCMVYLTLHAGVFGLSSSVTCSRRGEVPVSSSFTLPEPCCMNPGLRAQGKNCRNLLTVLPTATFKYIHTHIITSELLLLKPHWQLSMIVMWWQPTVCPLMVGRWLLPSWTWMTTVVELDRLTTSPWSLASTNTVNFSATFTQAREISFF